MSSDASPQTPCELKQHKLVSNAVTMVSTNPTALHLAEALQQRVYEPLKTYLPLTIVTHLQTVEKYVSSIDKENIIQAIDNRIDVVFEAQKEKKLTELLTQSVLSTTSSLLTLSATTILQVNDSYVKPRLQE